MVHTNPAYEEEGAPPPTTYMPNIRTYGGRIDLNLDTVDLFDRDTFIEHAKAHVEFFSEDMVKLMVKEYDDRKNPVKDDTVVS